MQLKDFIKNALVSIRQGVIEANAELKNNTALKEYGFAMTNKDHIDFDIAVTVTNTSNSEIGGEINVLSLSKVNANDSRESVAENSSRIKFWVKVDNLNN